MRIIVSVVLLQSAAGFKFRCIKCNAKCIVEDWNPSEEGYFFLAHIPNTTDEIKLVNLQNALLDGQFFSKMTRLFVSLSIENSPMLAVVIIPATCTAQLVIMHRTGVRNVRFEGNSIIKSVIIRRSPLRDVPVTLVTLPNVQHVLLQYTRIVSVDLHWFYPLKGLVTLKVMKSNVEFVHGAGDFNSTSALNAINLSYNMLRTVNLNVFAPFAELMQLVLTHNRIESLTGALNAPSLTGLMLDHNYLKALDVCAWNVLPELRGLALANNYLTQIPTCLERFPCLGNVDLKRNQISFVRWDELQKLPQLASINLSFNRISAIPSNESQYPPRLNQMDLKGNPIENATLPDGLNDSIHDPFG
uniref:Leucine rich immune protein (Coil-less) n=1 Tax=Anopheles christyi TaxID=43041 RepID=A0A182KD26_9DIPT